MVRPPLEELAEDELAEDELAEDELAEDDLAEDDNVIAMGSGNTAVVTFCKFPVRFQWRTLKHMQKVSFKWCYFKDINLLLLLHTQS